MKTIKMGTEEDINDFEFEETVIRVKAIMINDSNKILLGYSNGAYQFPGGHIKGGESLEEGLKREVKEETGIDIDVTDIKPFLKIEYAYKNDKRKSKIYYYLIKNDLKYNLNETDYDEMEIINKYKLKKLDLKDVKEELINNINNNPLNKYIVEEMIIALDECKEEIGSL